MAAKKRRRPSARRTIWVLLALLLLCFLFELNQWFPGIWPGGGGGGFLSAEQPTTDETESEAERNPPKERTVERIDGDEEIPKDWPRSGVIVEVRSADGSRDDTWHMGVGDDGPEDHVPNDSGTTRATTRKIFEEGFRVRAKTGNVRHMFGITRPAARWAIYLPSRYTPTQRLHAVAIQVRVTNGTSPVHGVEVHAIAPRSLEPAVSARTDESGLATLKGLRAIVKLAVSGNDAAGVPWVGDTWADPRDREPVVLRVVPAAPLRVSGPHPEIAAMRVRTASGIALPIETPANAGDGFEVPRPSRPLFGARLEIDFVDAASKSVFGMAYPIPDDGAIALGSIKTRSVSVQGTGTITAYYDAPEKAPEARPLQATATVRDGGVLVLPLGVQAKAVVSIAGFAPAAMHIPIDGLPRQWEPTKGRTVRVHVTDQDNQPLAGAEVLYRGAVEGLRVARQATTDGEGIASLTDLLPDAAELYVHAPGHAWESKVLPDDASMVRFALKPGNELVLVVAGVRGAPIAGARVEFRAMDSKEIAVTDPRVDVHESDENGVLVIPALPPNLYRVRVSAPGFRTAVYERLRPGTTTHFTALAARSTRARASDPK